MAISYPTPPPSRLGNQSADTSHQSSQDRLPYITEESPEEQELITVASKLVEQVLAKVVAEECLRLPTQYEEDSMANGGKDRDGEVSVVHTV